MILNFFKAGETFGEITFLTGETKNLCAKSLNVTHVACLKRSDYISLFQEFPDDYVKYLLGNNNNNIFRKSSMILRMINQNINY